MNTFELTDILNEVLSLELSWINHWAYEDALSKLLEMKSFAVKNKKQIEKEFGYDIEDIYKQLDEFEETIKSIPTITATRDEAIILAAIEYAKKRKMIISRRWGKIDSKLKAPHISKIDILLSRFFATGNLIAFYLLNKDNQECAERVNVLIFEYLDLSIELINLYPDEEDNLNPTGLTIKVLKKLIRDKNLSLAKQIFENYKLKPRGSETTALSKIKEKIYKE